MDNESEKIDEIKQHYNFALRCPRHPFMREYVLTKNNNICAHCGQSIANKRYYELIATTSDRSCWTAETIQLPKKTRNVRAPDCKGCQEKHSEEFEKCSSLLKPVHCSCRMEIDLGDELGALHVGSKPYSSDEIFRAPNITKAKRLAEKYPNVFSRESRRSGAFADGQKKKNVYWGKRTNKSEDS